MFFSFRLQRIKNPAFAGQQKWATED